MRKILFALFALTFTVLGGVGATAVLARPVPVPVEFPVTGTVSPAAGETGVAFTGTVTVASFAELDGQLTLQGTLTGATPDPVAVTIVASAVASEDTGAGCTVVIDTTETFIGPAPIISVIGARVTLSETAERAAARDLCRVAQTAAKDPADQRALARALNKVLKGI